MNPIAEAWLVKTLDKINSLQSYNKTESIKRISKKYNLNLKKCIILDSNENMFLSKNLLSFFAQKLSKEIDFRLYPEEELSTLESSIAKYLKLSSQCVMVGCGGDQLIDLITKTFLIGKSNVISILPTFSFYRISSEIVNAKYLQVPLNLDFTLNLNKILKMSKNSRICFIASPNNPTANQFKKEQIELLIESFPGMVILDEAYVEYGNYNASKWVNKYENLIVLRTFSKAFGLAGLRVGYIVANPKIIKPLSRKVQFPFPVSTFSLKMALEILKKKDLVQSSVKTLKIERKWLIEELNKLNLKKVFHSDSNFILIQIGKNLEKVQSRLLQRGIFLRHIGNVLNYEGCLRYTVGTHEMNEYVLDTLRNIVN